MTHHARLMLTVMLMDAMTSPDQRLGLLQGVRLENRNDETLSHATCFRFVERRGDALVKEADFVCTGDRWWQIRWLDDFRDWCWCSFTWHG